MIGISEVVLKRMNYCCRLSADSGRQCSVDELVFETLLFCQENTLLRGPLDLGHSPRNCTACAGKVRQLEGKCALNNRCAKTAKGGDLGIKSM